MAKAWPPEGAVNVADATVFGVPDSLRTALPSTFLNAADGRVGPCAPMGPCGPAGPEAPVGRAGPWGPGGPGGPGETVNGTAYTGRRAASTLMPLRVTSKYRELPAGKSAADSPPGRPSSRSPAPVSFVMNAAPSISTICGCVEMMVPAVALSQISNCTLTPVLDGGSVVAIGARDTYFEVGSSARTATTRARTSVSINNKRRMRSSFEWTVRDIRIRCARIVESVAGIA